MTKNLQKLLRGYRRGRPSISQVLGELRDLPYKELPFATVDLHRGLRRNFPEVIFGQGKTPAQIAAIAGVLEEKGNPVVVTRVSPSAARALRGKIGHSRYFPKAKILAGPIQAPRRPKARSGKGEVLVVTAGTGDIPVAEEAVVTLQLMGQRAQRLYDVGVAGLHRLLSHLKVLRRARLIIVVAGMDGALPSVVSGLVDCPVVAVPTSVGYGASLKGVAALLTMLNGCSPGVAVVNIDNGFGAGYLAAMILQKR